MTNKIWFDMDGTIADLYSVDGWLDKLIAEDESPYAIAKPLVRLASLAKRLNNLQRAGFEIGVISWLSKHSTASYDEKVTRAKREWLMRHLPSVQWDNILIVKYGQDKYTTCGQDGILFDDEEKNRTAWLNGKAFEPKDIEKILEKISKTY